MSVASILARCAKVKAGQYNADADELASEVEDLLGEAAPCGYAEPYASEDPATGVWGVTVPDEWGGSGESDRVRHMARMLLRAADEADAKNEKPP